MAQYLIQGDTLTNIADAIREKAGILFSLFPETMPSYIRSIKVASADSPGIPKDITAEADRVASGMISKMGSNSVTFIAMSDMHEMGDSDWSDPTIIERYQRANLNAGQGAKRIADQIDLDFFANLGDLVWGASNTTLHDWAQSVVKARGYTAGIEPLTECFFTPGNHDVDYAGGYHDENLVVGMIGSYRYVDLESKKVRVICLNTADTTDGTDGVERVSGKQLQWFANALDLSAKADAAKWGIIILSHHPLDYGNIKPVANCLAAYVNGTNYSTTHDGMTVSKDFTGKNLATVIANFHGHLHSLYVTDISGTTIKRIAIPNACFGRNNEYGTEATTYNKSDDHSGKNTAFCLVSIDLSKKRIYADCFGAGYDRVISYGSEEIVTYSITNILANATNSNGAGTVVEGSSYAAAISPNIGYALESLTVTMGGVDITSAAVNGGNISITEVTGDIVITAAAKANVHYDVTNLVLTAEAQDSAAVYNGVGYKNGVYLSSEGGEGTDAECVATGYIPYEWITSNVIYIRGAKISSASHVRIYGYDGKAMGPTSAAMCSGPTLSTYFMVEQLGDNYYKLTPVANKATIYLRVSLIGTGENLIVTVNEPIEASDSETILYSITHNLTNVTSSNTASTVAEGSAYSTALAMPADYEISSVKIIMGGVDITETAYNGNKISIAKVKGDIIITVAAKPAASYDVKNLVSTAQEMNSAAVYNGVGYKNGCYLSSSSPFEGADAQTVLTGYIPYAVPETGVPGTIYIRGAKWQNISHCRLFFFTEAKTQLCGPQIQGSGTGNGLITTHYTMEELDDRYYKLTPIVNPDSFSGLWMGVSLVSTVTNAEYIRLSLVGTGENLIITVNEPID